MYFIKVLSTDYLTTTAKSRTKLARNCEIIMKLKNALGDHWQNKVLQNYKFLIYFLTET